jgi:hypothetical protein
LFINYISPFESKEKEVRNNGITREEESGSLKGRKRGKGTLKGI